MQLVERVDGSFLQRDGLLLRRDLFRSYLVDCRYVCDSNNEREGYCARSPDRPLLVGRMSRPPTKHGRRVPVSCSCRVAAMPLQYPSGPRGRCSFDTRSCLRHPLARIEKCTSDAKRQRAGRREWWVKYHICRGGGRIGRYPVPVHVTLRLAFVCVQQHVLKRRTNYSK